MRNGKPSKSVAAKPAGASGPRAEASARRAAARGEQDLRVLPADMLPLAQAEADHFMATLAGLLLAGAQPGLSARKQVDESEQVHKAAEEGGAGEDRDL